MVDFSFYREAYLGDSIPDETEFLRTEVKARGQLERYKRIYRVTAPEEDSESMAICAMTDAIYSFQLLQSGGVETSSSIGSVSSSFKAPDVDLSPKAQAKELYQCASQYLNIYRGCG